MANKLPIQIATGELRVEEQRPLVPECQPNGDRFMLKFDENALSEGYLTRF
jgi:hypothetical protein